MSGGRPASESVMLAKLNGDKTYHGKACKKCGGTERYTRGGGSCVACQRAHSIESRAALKRIAEQETAVPWQPIEGTCLTCGLIGGHEIGCAEASVNDDSDSDVDSAPEERYLDQSEIPQPWD